MTDVTCAIIRNENNEVLIVQRGEKSAHPFKWEFPGGKTRPGESYEDCIIREIYEELSMHIVICSSLEPVQHDYENKSIRLVPFVCDTLMDKPLLNEHSAYRWICPEEMESIDFQEADIKVAEQYLKFTGRHNYKRRSKRERQGINGESNQFDEKDLAEIIDSLMSLKQVHWIVESAFVNTKVFRKLLEYSFSDKKRLAFRSSWLLTKMYDRHPDMIRPYLSEVIHKIRKLRNEGVTRSFMRILSFEEIKNFTKEEHGILADYCLESLNDPSGPVAIKAYSMEILYRLTVIYPELGNEVAASILSVMEEGSPAVLSKGKNVLRRITGITSGS